MDFSAPIKDELIKQTMEAHTESDFEIIGRRLDMLKRIEETMPMPQAYMATPEKFVAQ